MKDQRNNKILIDDLEFISVKSQWKYVDIKIASSEFPERYSKTHNHSESIKSKIKLLDSLIQNNASEEFITEFNYLKKEIKKSKLYRGSLIFDYMKYRFQYLENPNFNNPLTLRWHLINLGYELQEYLNETLNDGFYIFKSVRPIIVEDSIIYMTSTDTNKVHKIKIWDINKSDKLAIEKPEDSLIIEINLENGVGRISKNHLSKFPQGYQGLFEIKNKRGEIHYYSFTNK